MDGRSSLLPAAMASARFDERKGGLRRSGGAVIVTYSQS